MLKFTLKINMIKILTYLVHYNLQHARFFFISNNMLEYLKMNPRKYILYIYLYILHIKT